MDTNVVYFNQKQGIADRKEKYMTDLNIIETVNYYEDLRRFEELKGSDNLEEVAELTKRMNNYIQKGKINQYLLKDLQLYGESLGNEQELVICIKDLIYSVGDVFDNSRIDVKISKGDCFKVTEYSYNTITIKSFNDRRAIRMKKSTFRYYFGVINSKGKSIKEFFNSKIFREMEEHEN